MSVELERFSPELNIWYARLNGDGITFDAVCTIRAIKSDTLAIEGLCSRSNKDIKELFDAIYDEFKYSSYDKIRYVRRGKVKEMKIDDYPRSEKRQTRGSAVL